jgi:hypothetical protein
VSEKRFGTVRKELAGEAPACCDCDDVLLLPAGLLLAAKPAVLLLLLRLLPPSWLDEQLLVV